MNTILQVPINKDLKDRAFKVSSRMGFSSLQETVRVFLNQLASNEIKVSFEPPTVKLSAKNERRYSKMIDDIEKGRVKLKTFDTVDALMADLNK